MEDKIRKLEERVTELEMKLYKSKSKWECNHQTIPFGVHKRKCGICGEIFIVD